MKRKPKALVMLSGGLDSRLAVKILQEQCAVECVYFDTPFLTWVHDNLFTFAQKEGVKLHVIDCKKGKNLQEYISIIKNPKYGHGVGMNPCIDCRIFMLKKAKELARKIGADFIATGEVVGERPMSQNLKAMKIIEKESGLEGKLLRPLSAKLLPVTDVEKSGLIKRDKLFGIRGRSRKKQIELAKKFKITYPSPAGGCLLCEKEFTNKLKDLLEHKKKPTPYDIEVLKIGRHFRVGNCKIIVGRNENENRVLENLAKKLKAKKISAGKKSPITLIVGKTNQKVLDIAASLTVFYSDYKSAKISGKIYTKAKIDIVKKYRI